MHKLLLTFTLAAMVIFTSLPLSINDTQAATARVTLTKLKSEGFRSCKSLGNSGWTSVTRGETLDGNSRAGNRVFSLRYCFSSQSQCQQFISNINRIVVNLDRVRYKKCSPR